MTSVSAAKSRRPNPSGGPGGLGQSWFGAGEARRQQRRARTVERELSRRKDGADDLRAFHRFPLVAIVLSFTITSGALPALSRTGPPLDDSLPAPAIYAAFGSLDVIDPATGEVEGFGPSLPFTVSAMLANPVHARIYLFEPAGNQIAVVSTRTLQVLSTISVPNGLPLTFGLGSSSISPSGDRIYAIDSTDDGINVISTRTDSVVSFIPMGDSVGGVAVSNFGDRIYVSLPSQNRIAIIDPATDTVIESFLVGLCPKGGRIYEKCEVTGLESSADGRYLLGVSPRTGSVVGIDTIDDKVVGSTRVVFFACPYDTFVGVNAAANQVAIFTEGCERDATEIVEATPPFARVSYDFPAQKFAGAFTVAFDSTGTIGYAAGEPRFDHGNLLQFTSQSFRFIRLGAPSALVLAP